MVEEHANQLKTICIRIGDGSTRYGGESGLNLFVNDVKRVQVVEPPPLPQTSVTQELEHLHGLLTRGAITQGEFDDLKARLLGGATST